MTWLAGWGWLHSAPGAKPPGATCLPSCTPASMGPAGQATLQGQADSTLRAASQNPRTVRSHQPCQTQTACHWSPGARVAPSPCQVVRRSGNRIVGQRNGGGTITVSGITRRRSLCHVIAELNGCTDKAKKGCAYVLGLVGWHGKHTPRFFLFPLFIYKWEEAKDSDCSVFRYFKN